jgi:hypothetical protein
LSLTKEWIKEVDIVKDDLAGYIIMKADKTDYNMAFPENELQKV